MGEWRMKGFCILFAQVFLITFTGFVLCNVINITINYLFADFASFVGQLLDLPYLLYFIFSLIISLILTLVFTGKMR
jgi:hypothetical protein